MPFSCKNSGHFTSDVGEKLSYTGWVVLQAIGGSKYWRTQYLKAFFISKGVVRFCSQVLDVACWHNKACFGKHN